MFTTETFVIVGASLVGDTAAQVLRAEGFDGRIVLLGAEPHRPHEVPGLRKVYFAGTSSPAGAEVRLDATVTSLDRVAREVVLDDGERIAYDRLLLATGPEPRRLSGPGGEADGGPRRLEDGAQIRDAFRAGPRVAIIGADWIGLEAAAAARCAGLEVTVLDPADLPVLRVRGRRSAAAFAQVHREHGADLRVGVQVARPAGAGALPGVELGDGSFVAADLVLVAAGVTAVMALAADAGLDLTGARAGEHLHTADPAVFVAGDVDCARPGRHAVVDTWEDSRQRAAGAARSMLGQDVALDRGPYVFAGGLDVATEHVAPAEVVRSDRVVLRGDAGRREFVGFWPTDGRLLAGIDVNVWEVVGAVTNLVASGRRAHPTRAPRHAASAVLGPLLAAVFAGS